RARWPGPVPVQATRCSGVPARSGREKAPRGHGAHHGEPVAQAMTRRERYGISGVLAALLLLFFLTPILRRELLSPADVLFKSVPWRQVAAPDFEPANALLSDYVYVFRPWRAFTLAALKVGRIPLWDPYNYAGAPFLGRGETAVLYPV